jgi:hypothetical protein
MVTATSTIPIGPTDEGRHMTVEVLAESDVEKGYRCELARGLLEATDAGTIPTAKLFE